MVGWAHVFPLYSLASGDSKGHDFLGAKGRSQGPREPLQGLAKLVLLAREEVNNVQLFHFLI